MHLKKLQRTKVSLTVSSHNKKIEHDAKIKSTVVVTRTRSPEEGELISHSVPIVGQDRGDPIQHQQAKKLEHPRIWDPERLKPDKPRTPDTKPYPEWQMDANQLDFKEELSLEIKRQQLKRELEIEMQKEEKLNPLPPMILKTISGSAGGQSSVAARASSSSSSRSSSSSNSSEDGSGSASSSSDSSSSSSSDDDSDSSSSSSSSSSSTSSRGNKAKRSSASKLPKSKDRKDIPDSHKDRPKSRLSNSDSKMKARSRSKEKSQGHGRKRTPSPDHWKKYPNKSSTRSSEGTLDRGRGSSKGKGKNVRPSSANKRDKDWPSFSSKDRNDGKRHKKKKNQTQKGRHSPLNQSNPEWSRKNRPRDDFPHSRESSRMEKDYHGARMERSPPRKHNRSVSPGKSDLRAHEMHYKDARRPTDLPPQRPPFDEARDRKKRGTPPLPPSVVSNLRRSPKEIDRAGAYPPQAPPPPPPATKDKYAITEKRDGYQPPANIYKWVRNREPSPRRERSQNAPSASGSQRGRELTPEHRKRGPPQPSQEEIFRAANRSSSGDRSLDKGNKRNFDKMREDASLERRRIDNPDAKKGKDESPPKKKSDRSSSWDRERERAQKRLDIDLDRPPGNILMGEPDHRKMEASRRSRERILAYEAGLPPPLRQGELKEREMVRRRGEEPKHYRDSLQSPPPHQMLSPPRGGRRSDEKMPPYPKGHKGERGERDDLPPLPPLGLRREHRYPGELPPHMIEAEYMEHLPPHHRHPLARDRGPRENPRMDPRDMHGDPRDRPPLARPLPPDYSPDRYPEYRYSDRELDRYGRRPKDYDMAMHREDHRDHYPGYRHDEYYQGMLPHEEWPVHYGRGGYPAGHRELLPPLHRSPPPLYRGRDPDRPPLDHYREHEARSSREEDRLKLRRRSPEWPSGRGRDDRWPAVPPPSPPPGPVSPQPPSSTRAPSSTQPPTDRKSSPPPKKREQSPASHDSWERSSRHGSQSSEGRRSSSSSSQKKEEAKSGYSSRSSRHDRKSDRDRAQKPRSRSRKSRSKSPVRAPVAIEDKKLVSPPVVVSSPVKDIESSSSQLDEKELIVVKQPPPPVAIVEAIVEPHVEPVVVPKVDESIKSKTEFIEPSSESTSDTCESKDKPPLKVEPTEEPVPVEKIIDSIDEVPEADLSDWSDDEDDELLMRADDLVEDEVKTTPSSDISKPDQRNDKRRHDLVKDRRSASLDRSSSSGKDRRRRRNDENRSEDQDSSDTQENLTNQTSTSASNLETILEKESLDLQDFRSADEYTADDSVDYDPISDDELDALMEESETDANAQTGDAVPDALDVDWSSLQALNAKKETTPGSARRRFGTLQVLQRVGISQNWAGPELTAKILGFCKTQAENDEAAAPENGFKIEHPVAALHLSTVRAKAKRSHVLHRMGNFCQALCARQDLWMRRQLCKKYTFPKIISSNTNTAVNFTNKVNILSS